MQATFAKLMTIASIAAAAPLAQAQDYFYSGVLPGTVGPTVIQTYRPVFVAPPPVYAPIYRPAYYGPAFYGPAYYGPAYHRPHYPRPIPYGPAPGFSFGVVQPNFGFGLTIR
jgi:hypothetical protein